MGIEAFKINRNNSFQHQQHNHNTRNRNRFVIPQYRRLQISDRSLSYAIPNTWNNIPDIIKSTNSLAVFKKKLKLYLVEKYNEVTN